jgi:hypothetical protein
MGNACSSENNTKHNRGNDFWLLFAYPARHRADKRIARVFMRQTMYIRQGVNFFCMLWPNAPDLYPEARLAFTQKYIL